MSNLYETLEVSKNASKEVIDKAYHVLVKKYHPDLQASEEKKKDAQIKMQKINEAYDILSDNKKRQIYNLKLEQELEKQKRKEYQKRFNEFQREEIIRNQSQREERKWQGDKDTYQNNSNSSYQNIMKIQNEIFNSYKKAYDNYSKRKYRNENKKWTLKRFLGLIEALAVLAIIMVFLWLFPPTNKLIINMYETNIVIKLVADVIKYAFIGIWDGINGLFPNVN